MNWYNANFSSRRLLTRASSTTHFTSLPVFTAIMFGCLVAGRLLQTNLQQIDETHAIFELPSAGSINHICVFLLGTGELYLHHGSGHRAERSAVVPFPDGYGATVHFFWPGKGFQLLGM